MSKPRAMVVLTDTEIADFFPGGLWDRLKTLLHGHRRVFAPLANPSEWDQILAESPPEILVTGWKTPSLPSNLLVGQPGGLQYVCHIAGTVRKLIPRELISHGLKVTNWGSSISATVAESTLMMILMAYRRAAQWSIAMHREGAWKNEKTMTQSLLGRTVGIHGFGAISQKLIPMLRPFTDKIQSFSPHVPDELFDGLGVSRLHSLEKLFATSEVVVELAAAIPENHHIVTEGLLRSIPEGGVFVNIGRGEIVEESALLRVAAEGNLLIALDVYETEPLPADSPFRGMPNVTLLPHLGGPTRDRRRDSGALAVQNIEAYLADRPLDALVDLEVYDRSS